MQKRGLSQEGLKLIACVTMLLDHIGVVIVMNCFENATGASKGIFLDLYEILRTIGRLAFPIYCFLLAEGSVHTCKPVRYGLRLMICALLSELPYDFALWGRFNWQHQSVMVTLFLGFCALEAMKRCSGPVIKLLISVPFMVLAEFTGGDYGAEGIMLVVLFALTRDMKYRYLAQALGMWFIFSPSHAMFLNWIGRISITVQEWAVLAIIPIAMYGGRKITNHKVIQWAFYLFYPVHLLVLYLLGRF